MDITPDTIKDIAVDCVTQFINNQRPLSEGLAKHASDLGLNVDQIKRSVEATNQIGYLKLLGMNKDRTFEFPVAKYEDVMGHMVLPVEPEERAPDNSAGFDNSKMKGDWIVGGGDGDGDADDVRCQFDLQLAEKQAMARKGVMENHVLLADLEIEKAAVAIEIGDLVKKVSKDEWIIEKLAEVATEDDFPKLVKLATGKDACNVDIRKHVFDDSELLQARSLSGLLKKAYEVVQRESAAKDLDKQHYKADGLFKSAAIGGTTGPTPRPTMVGNTLASASKGVGFAAGGVAAGMTAPIAYPAAKLGRRAAAGIENAIHKTPIGGLLGPKKFQPAKPFGKLLPRGIAPLDIAMAASTPVDPEKSVWNVLQGEGKRY